MENNNLPIGTPQEAELNANLPGMASQAQSQPTENSPNMSTNAVSQTVQPGTNPPPAQTAVNYGSAPTSVPSAPTQTAYNPYQQPSSVSTTQAYPYQSAVYGSASANPNKKSVGKIVSLVLGIVLTLVGAFLTFCLAIYDIDYFQTYGEVEIVVPAYIMVMLPLVIGIVLIVFGCRKNKNPVMAVPQTAVGANYYATPQQFAAPATTATTANTPQTVASNSQPVASGQPFPTTDASTAPVDTAAQTQVAAPSTSTPSGASPMTYQYAPTTHIQGGFDDIAKKNARKSGFISIGIVVLMWIILFITDYIFWYLLILPIGCSISALKSNIKSVVGWLSLILSILSLLLFILLLIAMF